MYYVIKGLYIYLSADTLFVSEFKISLSKWPLDSGAENFPVLSQTLNEDEQDYHSRAPGAEWRAPEHRAREAQRAACRSAAGRRSRQPRAAARAESEGP